jgi:hypothetical protein
VAANYCLLQECRSFAGAWGIARGLEVVKSGRATSTVCFFEQHFVVCVFLIMFVFLINWLQIRNPISLINLD